MSTNQTEIVSMKSLVVLLMFLLCITGCNRQSPEQLMQQAQAAQQEAQRTVDSLGRKADVPAMFGPVLTSYEKVVNDHPSSPEAEQALFRLADLRMNVMHEPQKSVETFQRYVAMYPAGAKAPTAMFMVGYIYNNEMNNLDSAAAAYRRFLQLFPEDELATSAQFELNNLGKKPEDLFPPEVASGAAAGKTPTKPAGR
jgi:outer membrane protein assembly factor BamD (BamD/ComL family)